MISWQRLFPNLIIVLIVSLFLAGCVRPAPESATAVPPELDISDPNVGGGTLLDPTAVPHTAPPSYPENVSETPQTEGESEPSSEETSAEESPPTAAVIEVTATIEEAVAATATIEEAAPEEEAAASPAAETAPAEETASPTATETAPAAETTTAATSTDCPPEHVVQSGENLFRIGLQYGLSWVTLAQYNGITNPNTIIAGQTINIPCDAVTSPIEPTPPPADITTYTVQPGDNLFRISLKFDVSWVEIAEANGLVSPNQIYTGQVLKIPTSAPGSRPEFTHVIQQGETVFSIALQYGITTAALAKANNLQEPYVIYAGQTLIIPGNG